MKVYGQLEKAQLENLASAPSGAPLGYVYFDTAADQIKVKAASGFSTLVSKGLPPVGSIIAYSGGYFTSAGNGSFFNVLGNSFAAVNALVNADGWYVCDGSALNLSGSPIYAGTGRYLPDLSDSRFLMGSTAVGPFGGQNTTTLAATNLPSFSVSTDAFSAVVATTTVGSSTHTHNVRGSTNANIGINGSYLRGDEEVAGTWNPDRYYKVSNTGGSGDWVTSFSLARTGDTEAVTTKGSTAGPSSTQTVATTSNIPSHTHTISTGPTNGGMNATSLENRPRYLSVLYIQRVI